MILIYARIRRTLGKFRRRFERDVFDVFTRDVPDYAPSLEPSSYVIRWGSGADVLGCDAAHTELDETERRLGVRRLEFGHRVVVGLADDLVVFSMWVNPRNLNVPGLIKRRLREDQWFIYKAFTSPDHRGRKLYKLGMQFVLEEMRVEGLGQLVGYAHVKKKVSRKGLARLAFGSVGRMSQLRLPGVTHNSVSRELAAAFPEELERSNIPVR